MSDLEPERGVRPRSPDRKGSSERSKRSKRSKRTGNSVRSAISNIQAVHIDWAVGGAAMLLLGVSAFLFHWEMTFYPRVWLGATPEEVRYGFGDPSAKSGAAERDVWEYRQSNYLESVQFEAGRTAVLSCTSKDSSCPGVLGLAPGAFEDDIRSALGNPDTQVVSDGNKRLEYDALGLSFSLSRFQVNGVWLTDNRVGFLTKLKHFLIFLIP